MPSADTGDDPEMSGIAEIVPARAVLTELARGFLLVHATDTAHAVRFATGFLREQTGRVEVTRVESTQKVTLARLSLGRHYRGAVEPAELGGRR